MFKKNLFSEFIIKRISLSLESQMIKNYKLQWYDWIQPYQYRQRKIWLKNYKIVFVMKNPTSNQNILRIMVHENQDGWETIKNLNNSICTIFLFMNDSLYLSTVISKKSS
jgi:hypothetical protein